MPAAKRTAAGCVAVVMTAVFFVWLLSGCGASARETTIRTTLTATQAAEVTFVAYDHAHLDQLVKQATDAESGRVAVYAWGKKADEIEKGFALVYKAIAVAAGLEDDHSVQAMVAAALQLSLALKQAGVTP